MGLFVFCEAKMEKIATHIALSSLEGQCDISVWNKSQITSTAPCAHLPFLLPPPHLPVLCFLKNTIFGKLKCVDPLLTKANTALAPLYQCDGTSFLLFLSTVALSAVALGSNVRGI